MHVEIDPQLIEDVVFLVMRGREKGEDRALYDDYRSRLDALYEFSGDAHHREVAFRDFYAEYFRTLGCEQLLSDALDEYPLLAQGLDKASFFKAASPKQESGDLFVRKDRADGQMVRRAAVLRLSAQSFLQTERLVHFLRRELFHIADMLDPAFGYRPDLELAEETLARQNLIRDRYRALWSFFVDARLLRAGQSNATGSNGAGSNATGSNGGKGLLEKAFRSLGAEAIEGILRTLSMEETLTHTDLLAIAKTGSLSDETEPTAIVQQTIG